MITGTLKNARYDKQNNVFWGFIYGDTRGRFSDGTWIHTSTVVENAVEDNGTIKTLNSIYKVEMEDSA